MGHRGHCSRCAVPTGGIHFNVANVAQVFVFKNTVCERVVVEFSRETNVLYTVFGDCISLTLLPPLPGLESIARLAPAESRFGKRLEPDTPAEDFLHLVQQIQGAYVR